MHRYEPLTFAFSPLAEAMHVTSPSPTAWLSKFQGENAGQAGLVRSAARRPHLAAGAGPLWNRGRRYRAATGRSLVQLRLYDHKWV